MAYRKFTYEKLKNEFTIIDVPQLLGALQNVLNVYI